MESPAKDNREESKEAWRPAAAHPRRRFWPEPCEWRERAPTRSEVGAKWRRNPLESPDSRLEMAPRLALRGKVISGKNTSSTIDGAVPITNRGLCHHISWNAGSSA